MAKLTEEEKNYLSQKNGWNIRKECPCCNNITKYSTLEDDILEISNHKFVYKICPYCGHVSLLSYDYLHDETPICSKKRDSLVRYH